MTRNELVKMLRKDAPPILMTRFAPICLDPRATVSAVNDFDSFQIFWRSVRNPSARRDRMKKLFNLYLAVSKTPSAFSLEQFECLKTTVPGYEKTSMSFFLDDLAELISVGVLIVNTPILDAIERLS